MSDANAFAFGKFIPGFEFLQQLASAQKAGAGVPGLGQWVAPTVSVDELDRRIQELKAVQFWLDQNVTALKATVQALEVQKMTLATLQGMNVSMAEVAKAFTVPVPEAAAPSTAPATPQQWPFDQGSSAASAPSAPTVQAEPAPAAAPEPVTPPAPAAPPVSRPSKSARAAAPAPADAPALAAAGLADGMQWWGALTQQFQQIAANALRDAAPSKPAAAPTSEAGAKPQRPATAKKKPPAKRGAAKTAATQKKAAAAKKAAAESGARESAPARHSGWPLPPSKPR